MTLQHQRRRLVATVVRHAIERCRLRNNRRGHLDGLACVRHSLHCTRFGSPYGVVRFLSVSSHTVSNADASFQLGSAYYEAKHGKPKDDKQALVHFTDAATKGHTVAAERLGVMYLTGYGAPRDLSTALSFFSMAARGGNPQAQLHLASMLHKGLGTARDAAQAAVWFRTAAQAGSTKAAVRYASMLLSGDGVSRSYAEALPWLERGVQEGDKDAQYLTAMLLSHRHPHAPSRAFPAVASRAEAFATVPFDAARALSLLRSAADCNHIRALTALADYYCSLPSPKYAEAVSVYAIAADNADVTAQSRLAFLLHHGVGCEADRQRAVTLLSTAAEGGRVEAQLLLMLVAAHKGDEAGGVVGKLRLKVDEVLKEYASKAVDSMDRSSDEWSDSEKQTVRRFKDDPRLVVQWVAEFERERGAAWLGDLHELLATVTSR